jgi:NitT/TauT family transport system permease protein
VKDESSFVRTYVLPVAVALSFIALWGALSALHGFPKSAFPSPLDVISGFKEEITSGRLWNDLVASLFRVSLGFVLAVVLSIPLGLLLGQYAGARAALLPTVNFFRSLSPLAWIPFAILWFGVGDLPVVFLIFMATFFSLVLAVIAGVAWLVVVAAEMIAGRDGLGFAIWDARNGLRTDLLVCGMIVIGVIGVVLDRLLVRLTRLPNVRWGYER